MASTVSGTEDQRKRDAREFASAVLTGTVIGRTLQDALQSMSREDTVTGDSTSAAARVREPARDSEDDRDADSDSTEPPVREVIGKPIVTMDNKSLGRILESFGEGVAQSRIVHQPEKDGAPRALLKGRCDYFNRYGQNWMVAMDGVKVKARPTKFTKRRRDDRPSLWDRDNDGGKNSQKEIVVNKKIQLLAYGDIA